MHTKTTNDTFSSKVLNENERSKNFTRSRTLEATGFMIGQQRITQEMLPKKIMQQEWREQLEADRRLAPADIGYHRKVYNRNLETAFGARQAAADSQRTVMGMTPNTFLRRGELIRERLRQNRQDVTAALSTSKSSLNLRDSLYPLTFMRMSFLNR